MTPEDYKMEYSIAAEELKEMFELVNNGWKAEDIRETEWKTLYIKFSKNDEVKKYEFVNC